MPESEKNSPSAPAQDARHAANAVHSEVATTKTPDQKTEIARELFPPVKTKRQIKTHRVIH